MEMETKTETEELSILKIENYYSYYSFDEFMLNRTIKQMNYNLKTTIFEDSLTLYNFMYQFNNIYLCGSFALSVFSLITVYEKIHDMDFYISVKNKSEISEIIGKIITSDIFDKKKMKIDICNEYDFSSNIINVYSLNIYGHLLDFVFITGNIEDFLEETDFNILKNYISVNNKNSNTFIFKSFYFEDILDSKINISQKYIDFINKTITLNNKEYYRKKIILRLNKYTKRGYKINNIGNKPNIDGTCAVCLVEQNTLIKSRFECTHNTICMDCFINLNNLSCPICCPICRANINKLSYHYIINEYHRLNQTFFTHYIVDKIHYDII